jgi:hypothetical protein
MPENQIGDSDQVARTVDTNQPSSQNEGGKPGSFDAKALQTAIDSIAKKVEEIDARSKSLQGDKDRSVVKTNKEVEELKRKFAEIEKFRKAGYDDDTAFEESDFRDAVRALKNQIATVSQAPAGNGVVDVAKVIAETGLDAQDPEVVASGIAGKQYASVLEAENAALRLKLQKATKPQPSDADRVSSPLSPPSPQTAEGLKSNYIKDAQAARGSREKMLQVQAEYQKRGLDTGQIDLAKELHI